MTSRLLPLLLLGAIGCSGQKETAGPQSDLRQVMHRHKVGDNPDVLAEALRRQGKDVDAYLGFPGYTGSYAMTPKLCGPIKVRGRAYSILSLVLAGFSIPGDCAERFVLLDGSGQVLDVVTVIWPSRLEDRFAVELDAEPDDGNLIRVWDAQAGEFWGNFTPPYIVLGEMTKKESPRVPLSWRGERLLGALGIEKDRFVAVKR